MTQRKTELLVSILEAVSKLQTMVGFIETIPLAKLDMDIWDIVSQAEECRKDQLAL